MTTPARRHLASSPFQPEPEPIIETFEMGDLVCHDAHGVGRIIGIEANAVTIELRDQSVRIPSPYRKLVKL